MKNRFIYCLFAMILVYGCQQEESFTTHKWNLKEDIIYLKRKKIVNDLIKNHLDKYKMCRDEIIDLLGKTNRVKNYNENELYYEIDVKYGLDIDPEWTKYLRIKLNDKSCYIGADIIKID